MTLLQKFQTWVLGAAVLGTTLVFHRGIADAFDLTKATILWFAAALLLLTLVPQHARIRRIPGLASIGLLLASLSFSTITSARPWQSLFGQYQRNTGLFSLLSCVILLLVCSVQTTKAVRAITWCLLGSASVAALYTVIQESGLDPWEWVTPGQDRAVFGTLGNSNTTGGFIGCLVALVSIQAGFALTKWSRIGLSVMELFLVGAVAILDAFQGVVAAALGVFAGLVVVLGRRMQVTEVFYSVWVSGCAAISLFAVDSSADLWVLLAFSFLAIPALWINSSTRMSIVGTLVENRKRVVSAVFGLTILFSGTLVVLGGEISRQFSDGMRERRYFYGSALRTFADSPFVGHGLETFGLYFTRFRDAQHGLVYETNRSSSVHSIQLGMFSNGGLLLGISYLIFLGSIFFIIVKNRRTFLASGVGAGIATAWVITQVQSLVSVEHVALFTQQFVLAGLVIAIVLNEKAVRIPKKGKRDNTHTMRAETAWIAASVFLLAVLLPVLLRPVRADSYGLWALRYSALGDPQAAVRAAERAKNLAPWSAEQAKRFAQASYEAGSGEAPDLAVEVANSYDFTPPYAIEAAYRVAEVGRFDEARQISELAVLRDPHAQTLRDSVSDLYIQIGSFFASQGDVAAARIWFEEAIQIDPSEEFRQAAVELLENSRG